MMGKIMYADNFPADAVGFSFLRGNVKIAECVPLSRLRAVMVLSILWETSKWKSGLLYNIECVFVVTPNSNMF